MVLAATLLGDERFDGAAERRLVAFGAARTRLRRRSARAIPVSLFSSTKADPIGG
jgi:hypothetical protein